MKNEIFIGHEYLGQTWIIPEEIYVAQDENINYYTNSIIGKDIYNGLPVESKKLYTKIKNTGLRVTTDFMTSGMFSYYRSGEMIVGGGISVDGHKAIIPIRNLLPIIQSQGLSKEGVLSGTYRVLTKEPGYIRLIPEGCKEEKFKSEITKIYESPGNFTSKWIPGHMYITKSKRLFLCLSSEELLYQKGLGCWNMYSLLSCYSETPRKIKVVCELFKDRLDEIDTRRIKDLGSFITGISYGEIYSSEYSGKDLGELLVPGAPWKDLIIEYLKNDARETYVWRSYPWYFVNLKEKLGELKEPLKKVLTDLKAADEKILDYARQSNKSAAEFLRKDLGL